MGEAIGISRAAWAALQQLVGAGVNAGAPASSGGRGGATDAMILIRNGCGSTLLPGHIVGLDGIVNTPATHPNDWDFYRLYKTVKPDPKKRAFAVAIEEIADGKAGFAFLTGVCKVKVDVKNQDHRYARPIKDELEHMESCVFGPARLLFRASGFGVGPALILFPLGDDEAVRFGEMTSPPSTAGGEGQMKPDGDATAMPVKDPMDLRPGQGDPVVAARDDEGKWSLVEAGRDAKLVKVLSGSGNTFTVQETSPSGVTWGPSFQAEGVD